MLTILPGCGGGALMRDRDVQCVRHRADTAERSRGQRLDSVFMLTPRPSGPVRPGAVLRIQPFTREAMNDMGMALARSGLALLGDHTVAAMFVALAAVRRGPVFAWAKDIPRTKRRTLLCFYRGCSRW